LATGNDEGSEVMRRIVVGLAALALVAGACGGEGDVVEEAAPAKGKVAEPAESVARTEDFTVKLEPRTDEFNVEWTTFFPNKLKAHPGDRIEFLLERFSGVPHTVTLGTLIDQAMASSADLPPGTTIPVAEKVLTDMKVPDPFPHGVAAGPPLVNQSAAQPCFLAEGTPPFNESGGAPACPETEQPEFDGTQAFYNSGVLNDSGETFDVTLSDSIKPGTYNMMCLIHRQPMSGQLTVAAEDEDIPGPDDVAAAGRRQREELVRGLQPTADKAQQATPDKAVAGSGDIAVAETVIAEFGPKELSVPVGGTVTWELFSFHTIAFNAEDSHVGIFQKGADGSWALVEKAAAPFGFDTPPEAAQFPPGPEPITIDGGAWNGSGFRNTGLLGSLPPQLITVKQTFTRAGTYSVRCLIHPEMKGQVKVG
jgi:plastocyanin